MQMIREITREGFSLEIINKNLFAAKKGVYITHAMLLFHLISCYSNVRMWKEKLARFIS